MQYLILWTTSLSYYIMIITIWINWPQRANVKSNQTNCFVFTLQTVVIFYNMSFIHSLWRYFFRTLYWNKIEEFDYWLNGAQNYYQKTSDTKQSIVCNYYRIKHHNYVFGWWFFHNTCISSYFYVQRDSMLVWNFNLCLCL